jgi:hypothetical protein
MGGENLGVEEKYRILVEPYHKKSQPPTFLGLHQEQLTLEP